MSRGSLSGIIGDRRFTSVMVAGLPAPYVERRGATVISTVLLYRFLICVVTKKVSNLKSI